MLDFDHKLIEFYPTIISPWGTAHIFFDGNSKVCLIFEKENPAIMSAPGDDRNYAKGHGYIWMEFKEKWEICHILFWRLHSIFSQLSPVMNTVINDLVPTWFNHIFHPNMIYNIISKYQENLEHHRNQILVQLNSVDNELKEIFKTKKKMVDS